MSADQTQRESAIESINEYETPQRLMRFASAQQDFLTRYAELLPDDRRRSDFQRELIYLVHLAYREAQEPLTKQLTEFVLTYNRPFLMEVKP